MATPHVYSIDLDIHSTAASKQALKTLEDAFKKSGNSLDALNNTYEELAKHTEDTTELEKQYNKIIAKQIAEKDKLVDKLKAEQIAITANRDLTQEQREEALKIKDAEIKRIENEKKLIKAKEKSFKLYLRQSKIIKSSVADGKAMLKITNGMVKLQEKLNNLIGKEGRLRKAAAKVAGVAKGGAGAAKAIKGGGGWAMGTAGMIVGALENTANKAEDKAKAMASLKSGIPEGIVDQVYIKSGADFASIVAAVNNLSMITKDGDKLVQGAVLELQNPGAGRLLLTTSDQKTENIANLTNAIQQIRRQTGTQDLTAALEASMKSSQVTEGKVSQTQYLQAYTALEQAGFEAEAIDKIIKSAASKGGSFIDNLNKLDLTKFTGDEQFKNRLKNMGALGLTALDFGKSEGQSKTQETLEKIRQFELVKDEMLLGGLELLKPGLEAIEPDDLKNLIKNLLDFWKAFAPDIDLKGFFKEKIPKLTQQISFMVKYADAILRRLPGGPDASISDIANIATANVRAIAGGMNAQGGIVNAPAIVGEAGPELVIPLSGSRSGRAGQIIQNFNTSQNFNMAANERTPLAFAAAVGRNRFVNRTTH